MTADEIDEEILELLCDYADMSDHPTEIEELLASLRHEFPMTIEDLRRRLDDLKLRGDVVEPEPNKFDISGADKFRAEREAEDEAECQRRELEQREADETMSDLARMWGKDK